MADQNNTSSSEKPGQKKVSLFSLLSKKLGWVGNLCLILSFLSTLAKLKTWQDFRHLVGDLSTEFLSILDFFGRIVHFILIPWRAVSDFFFDILPLQVPSDWHDAIIIGLFVIWLPIIEIVNLLINASRRMMHIKLNQLMSLIDSPPLPEQYHDHGKQIAHIITTGGTPFMTMMYGPPLEYIKALNSDLLPEQLEPYRQDFIHYLQSPEIAAMFTDPKFDKDLLKKRLRGLIAAFLLILITIDHVHIKRLAGFKILWLSFLTLICLAVGSILLYILFYLVAGVIIIGIIKLVDLIFGKKTGNKLKALFVNKLYLNRVRKQLPKNWTFASKKIEAKDFE